LNATTPNTRITRQALEAFGDAGGELAPVVISNRVAFAESALDGESVISVAPGSAAADEVHRLYAVITGEEVAHA
jgi:chromosome partitioning protein